jgi:hypothetical protein
VGVVNAVMMVVHSTVGRFDSPSCTLMTTVGPGRQGAHPNMIKSPLDTLRASYPFSPCASFYLYRSISFAVFKLPFQSLNPPPTSSKFQDSYMLSSLLL